MPFSMQVEIAAGIHPSAKSYGGKKSIMATTEELVRISGQSHEIIKRVGNGSLDARNVREALQLIIEGKMPERSRLIRILKGEPVEPYGNHLLSLDEQLVRIRDYNALYWDGRFSDEELLAISTESSHTQGIDDLEILHVEFGSLAETIEMWWKVFVGEQPAYWRWDEFKPDPKHLRLNRNTRSYKPGIHRVRIDLVAHWQPDTGRTLEEVRQRAKGRDEVLAQTEVMSAYGIHSELLREQDGKNLPYSDIPGTEVMIPGDEALAGCLYLRWDPGHRLVGLDAHGVDDGYTIWSAPVLREP
jgi:hypothetical protein